MNSESKPAGQPVIEVCYGPECSDCGGRELGRDIEARGFAILEGDCRDQCPNAPLVLVDNRMITDATTNKVLTRVQDILAAR